MIARTREERDQMIARTIEFHSYNKLCVGGAPFGAGGRNVEYLLVCPTCGGRYPMARDPVALALSPEGATVLVGYVEVCPFCNAGHGAGTVLEVDGSGIVKHTLPPLSLYAARSLKTRCPQHDMPARSCTTSHDVIKGDMAKITFDCACTGAAVIKRQKAVQAPYPTQGGDDQTIKH